MGRKVCWVALHAFCVGLLPVLDSDLRRHILELTWIATSYYVLLALTMVQIYYTTLTVGSSPGYVVDEDSSSASDSTLDSTGSTGRIPSGINSVTNVGAAEGARNGQNVHRSTSDTTPLLAHSSIDTHQAQGTASSLRVNVSNTRGLDRGLNSPPKCPFCNVIKPVRTQHCRVCQKCVSRFDHHCAILGTCVGQRNHRNFWWFLCFETLLTFWTVINYGSAMNSNGSEKLVVLVILLELVACLLFLIPFLLFHTYLVVTNQTTYETLKKRRDISYLKNIPSTVWYPFSKGFISNVRSFCCTPSDAILDYDLPVREDLEAARARGRCG